MHTADESSGFKLNQIAFMMHRKACSMFFGGKKNHAMENSHSLMCKVISVIIPGDVHN